MTSGHVSIRMFIRKGTGTDSLEGKIALLIQWQVVRMVIGGTETIARFARELDIEWQDPRRPGSRPSPEARE
jgi:hypothetical protein